MWQKWEGSEKVCVGEELKGGGQGWEEVRLIWWRRRVWRDCSAAVYQLKAGMAMTRTWRRQRLQLELQWWRRHQQQWLAVAGRIAGASQRV